MKRLARACVVALGMLALSAPALAYEAMVGPTGVLKYDKDKAYNGYRWGNAVRHCAATGLRGARIAMGTISSRVGWANMTSCSRSGV